jgi:hypothetical protein
VTGEAIGSLEAMLAAMLACTPSSTSTVVNLPKKR